MKFVIGNPANLSEQLIDEVIQLVHDGGQIPMAGLRERILNAEFIALYLDGENVAATATFKNPNENYTESVFESAAAKSSHGEYKKELGYIVTNPDYEGKKLCQNLLTEVMPHTGSNNIFATTRKPAMGHILEKFGFQKDGNTYKEDLNLYVLSRSDNTK